jgi:hypothetical protein
MTEKEIRLEDAKALLDANKQALQVLNKKVELLEEVANEEGPEAWQVGRRPYIYTAVGSDGDNGILIEAEDNNYRTSLTDREVFEGRVRVQSDAPFVWTHILTGLLIEPGFESTDNIGFGGIQGDGEGNTSLASLSYSNYRPTINLGFIEEGSSRQLFQSDQQDLALANTKNRRGELLSPEFVNTIRFFAAWPSTSAVVSVGHGPNEPFSLPAECLLPANDVVTVKARPNYWNQNERAGYRSYRVYVGLLGYKILEE